MKAQKEQRKRKLQQLQSTLHNQKAQFEILCNSIREASNLHSLDTCVELFYMYKNLCEQLYDAKRQQYVAELRYLREKLAAADANNSE